MEMSLTHFKSSGLNDNDTLIFKTLMHKHLPELVWETSAL